MPNKLHVAADYEVRSANSPILILTVDFVDPLCYTTPNKPHRNGKNQVSPTWCDHQVHVKAISCRFKSCYLHQKQPDFIGLFCYISTKNGSKIAKSARYFLADARPVSCAPWLFHTKQPCDIWL